MMAQEQKEGTTDQLSDHQRWRAVCERNQAYDGTFFFAVLTTGIYCRPSCSSRRANRENVSFFDSAASAEQAGYRACKRCRPNQIQRPAHAEAILRACHTIESADQAPNLTSLASQACLSPAHFQRLFKTQVGLSPKQYAMAIRKQRLRETLVQTESVTQAIHDAGYRSASSAYAEKTASSLKPQQLLQGGDGEVIRYACGETSLGRILVAATDEGVCLVEFLGEIEAIALMRKNFPAAKLQLDGSDLAKWVTSIVARIDTPYDDSVRDKTIPLAVRGTVFQEEVWRAVSQIPVGETVSYKQLAERMGRPKSARSVATAIGANRLAVLIPCHRVVRGTGEVAGYRWGKERKRKLLENENR